jgi:hypothetical protein
MIQSSTSAIDRGLPPPGPPIQFYSIELTPLADGHVAVGIGATFCEAADDDFELVHMDVANERVDTIDQALAVIREAVVTTMPN